MLYRPVSTIRATQSVMMSRLVIRTLVGYQYVELASRLLRPAERAVRPEGGGEPGVEDVGILRRTPSRLQFCLEVCASSGAIRNKHRDRS